MQSVCRECEAPIVSRTNRPPSPTRPLSFVEVYACGAVRSLGYGPRLLLSCSHSVAAGGSYFDALEAVATAADLAIDAVSEGVPELPDRPAGALVALGARLRDLQRVGEAERIARVAARKPTEPGTVPIVVQAAREYLRTTSPGFEEGDPDGFAADVSILSGESADPATHWHKELSGVLAALDVADPDGVGGLLESLNESVCMAAHVRNTLRNAATLYEEESITGPMMPELLRGYAEKADKGWHHAKAAYDYHAGRNPEKTACTECNGTGREVSGQPPEMWEDPCRHCGGIGHVFRVPPYRAPVSS